MYRLQGKYYFVVYKKQVFLKSAQLKTQGPCRDCELKSIYFGLHTSYKFQDTDYFLFIGKSCGVQNIIDKKTKF